jgi:hypothetical protein
MHGQILVLKKRLAPATESTEVTEKKSVARMAKDRLRFEIP